MVQIEIVGGSLGYALAVLVERNPDGSVKKIVGYAVIGPDGQIMQEFDTLEEAVALLKSLIEDMTQDDEDTYKGNKP